MLEHWQGGCAALEHLLGCCCTPTPSGAGLTRPAPAEQPDPAVRGPPAGTSGPLLGSPIKETEAPRGKTTVTGRQAQNEAAVPGRPLFRSSPLSLEYRCVSKAGYLKEPRS